MKDITQQIHLLITEKLGIEEYRITDNADFRKDFNIDSLDLFELFDEIEKRFGIILPDETAEKINTVGQLIAFVTSQQH